MGIPVSTKSAATQDASTAAATGASVASTGAGDAGFAGMMATYSATEEAAMAKNITFMIAQAGFSPMQKVSKADASS